MPFRQLADQGFFENVLLYGTDNYARVSYAQSDNESDAMTHDLTLVAK